MKETIRKNSIDKRWVTLALIMVLTICSTFCVNARTDTVTKSTDLVTVKFQYTSYTNESGRRVVKDGKVISMEGKHGLLWVWSFVPKKSSIKHIDGGRTYEVTVYGKLYTVHPGQDTSVRDEQTKLYFSAK